MQTVGITKLNLLPNKKSVESYWNAYYTFITGLSATNTTVPVIQCILQYSSFITVHSRAAVIGCMSWRGKLSV